MPRARPTHLSTQRRLHGSTRSTSTQLSMAHQDRFKLAIPNFSIPRQVRLRPCQIADSTYLTLSVNLFAAMNSLGLQTQFDPNDGTSAGPAFVPTDLDPKNQTRSDARRTYFDPYVNRPNLHVITGQHVTRVLVEGVANNSQVSNPSTGGNINGDGTASGNNDGFGFGPGGSTPPIAGQAPPRLQRRQTPNGDLRITGVEVSHFFGAKIQFHN